MSLESPSVDYSLVTIVNQRSGGVNLKRVSSLGDPESVFEQAVNVPHLRCFRTSRGLTEEKFLEKEGSREWMVERVSNLSNLGFNQVMMKGVPDYMVAEKKRKRLSFVEVKKAGDGLRPNQLKWMRMFRDAPVKIAYVEKPKHLEER